MKARIKEETYPRSDASACSPDFSHCQWCGAELSTQKQRTFKKTARHMMLRHGKPMPAGPFCNVQCRSDYFGEIKDRELINLISENAGGHPTGATE